MGRHLAAADRVGAGRRGGRPRRWCGAAEEGIAEVAAGTPSTSGAPAVAALRARVWGRPVPGTPLPSGAAFVAHALAFVRETDPPVGVFASGPWTRLTTPRGHVLARSPLGG